MILFEGIRNIALPCTLALVLPSMIALAAGRLRPMAAAGIVGGAGLMAWTAAVGWVRLGRGTGVDIAIGLVFALAFTGLLLASRGERTALNRAATLATGTLAGAVTSLLWEPCVGELLGRTLTAAPRDPVGTLLPMVLFVVGALLPVWLTSAAATPLGEKVRNRIGPVGIVLGGTLALVIAVGAWRDVVSTLVRVTLA